MGGKNYKWVILLTSGSLMMFFFMVQITWVMNVTQEVEAGIDSINNSFGVSSYPIAMLGFSIPVFTQGAGNFLQGNLVHRIGFRRTFLIFAPLLIVPQFIIPLLPNLAEGQISWAICLSLRGLQGIGLPFGVLSPLIGLWFPLEERGMAQGVFMTFVGVNSGVGALFAVALGDWAHTFIFLGCVMLMLSAIWVFLVREPPLLERGVERKETRKGDKVSIYRSGATWLTVWIISINCWVVFGTTGNAAPYLRAQGVDATMIGLTILFFSLASLVAAPLSGVISDKLILRIGAIRARSYSVSLGFGLATVLIVVYPGLVETGIPALIVAGTFLLGIGGPWSSGPGWALPADLDPHEAGAISGLALIMGQAVGGIAGQTVAIMGDSFAWPAAWSVLALVAAFGVMPCLLLPKIASTKGR